MVTVADNGIGMSQEFQKHIFEPFERERTSTVSKVEGSGIGMGIVKKLVGLMGGTVAVESKIGVGSKFTVTIPCRIASEDETQAKREINPSDQKCLCGTRILLTEDNDLNAEIATELLQEEGCTVDRAKDGVECVDMLEKSCERNVSADPYGHPDARDERLRCDKKDSENGRSSKSKYPHRRHDGKCIFRR